MKSQGTGLRTPAEKSVLVVVDVQEKLFPLMQEKELLASRLAMLMRGAEVLNIPILVTEQYVKGLGHTIAALKSLPVTDTIEKVTFSCFGEAAFRETLRNLERTHLVLCGIEAHICVMQTALDGIAAGHDVLVVEDAVSTRLSHTRELGLQRMRGAGVASASAEGILFEWLESCEHQAFKSLLPLFKESI